MPKQKVELDGVFAWEGWDMYDTMCFGFYDVTFLRDFGVFKTGDKYDSVQLAWDRGLIEALDEDGEVVRSQFFHCVPSHTPMKADDEAQD